MGNDRLAGIFFLALFVGYGWLTQDIYLDLWAEEEVFNARSFPTLIAAGGIIVSLLLIFTPTIKVHLQAIESHRLVQGFLLIVVMVVYGLGLETVGFVPGTALFLLGCSWILGERSVLFLSLGALPLPLSFYMLMDFLGIYLPPGKLFELLAST